MLQTLTQSSQTIHKVTEIDLVNPSKVGPPQRFPRGGGGGLNQGSRFPAPSQFGASGPRGGGGGGPRFNNPFGNNDQFRDGPDERLMQGGPNPMRDDRLGGGPMMPQEEFRNPNRPFGFQGSHHSVFDDNGKNPPT